MKTKKPTFRSGLIGLGLLVWISDLNGQFLYNGYINPGFTGIAEYSGWDVFYSANTFPNFPDAAAPHGDFGSASAAGFADPTGSAWNPANPLAFWDSRNPTLTNVAGGAFLIGPGFTGNIYSFSETLRFRIADEVEAPLESVLLQFGTAGTSVDFDGIRLRYIDGGVAVELQPAQWVREFRGSGSSFGGNANRNALEWDLRGLGVTDYEIEFGAEGTSLSLQEVLLDTTDAYASVVPNSGMFRGAVGHNWDGIGNWDGGSVVEPNGNLLLEGGSVLSTGTVDRTVGLIRFGVDNDFRIEGSGELRVNTGYEVDTADVDHVVATAVRNGGIQDVYVGAGSTLTLAGSIGGDYGFEKRGAGALVLEGANSFGGGIGISGGTVTVAGSHSGSPTVAVLRGKLEVLNGAGLGSGSTLVNLGADSGIFSFDGDTLAEIRLTGMVALNRGIAVAPGLYQKRLTADATGAGARILGDLDFTGSGSDLEVRVVGGSDRLLLEGDLSMPNEARLVKTGAGTLEYAGGGNPRGGFSVEAGTFRIADRGSMTSTGSWTVAEGAILGGSGILGWRSGETVSVDGILLADGGRGGLGLEPGDEASLVAGLSPAFRFDFREGPVAMSFGAIGAWIEGWERFRIELLLPDDFNYNEDRTLFENLVLANPEEIRGISGHDGARFRPDLLTKGDDIVLRFAAIPEPASAGIWIVMGLAGRLLWRRNRS